MKSKMQKMITLDNMLYIVVSLYVLDVILLGTGDLIRVGGISSRIIFFFIAMVLSIPAIIKNFRVYIKNTTMLAVAFFMIMVVVATVVGLLNGNYRPILISDIKGYLNLLIVIPMGYILSNKERLMKLIKVMLNSIFVVSLICIVLSYYQFFSQKVQELIYNFVHEIGFAAIAGLTENATRIFMHSGTRMFTLGLLLSFALYLIENNKKEVRYLQMATCLVATFMSYARALYVGLFITVAVLLFFIAVYYKEYLKVTLKSYVIVLVLAAIIITVVGISQQSNLFKVAINRCLVVVDSGVSEVPGTEEPGTEEDDATLDNLDSEVASLEIRVIRKEMALENFSKNPIVGNGMGVVNDPDNGYIEYFYLDLLSKMGIVGLLLFVLPAVLALYKVIAFRDRYEREQRILSLIIWCDLLFLMFISYFNPCMNTATGLMIYAFAISLSIPWGTFENATIERRR